MLGHFGILLLHSESSEAPRSLRQATVVLLTPGTSLPGCQVPWVQLNGQVHPLQPAENCGGFDMNQ